MSFKVLGMALEKITNNYHKYQNKNPFMQWFIRRFVNRICCLVDHFRPERLVDIGCGEGIVAGALQKNNFSFEYYGIDINKKSIETAKLLNPSLFFETADFLTMNPKLGWANVVLCLEVRFDLRRPGALVIERPAGRRMHHYESERDDQQKRRDSAQDAVHGVAQHDPLRRRATRARRDSGAVSSGSREHCRPSRELRGARDASRRIRRAE